MKRFALTICLAACLVFAFGATSFAVDRVEVESGSIGIGGTLTVGVFVENDADVRGIVIPLVVREIDPGSFVTSMQMTLVVPGNRNENSLTEITATNQYDVGGDNGTQCSVDHGFSGATSTDEMSYPVNNGSPMGLLFSKNRILSANIAPGSDFGGIPTHQLTFGVTTVPGFFEIDTTCVDPSNHLSFVLNAGGSSDPAFTKGLIEILPNLCPTASAGDVTATAGSGVTNQVSASDPEGDPISYFLVSGPGSVDANGLWSYTPMCADVPGFDVTIEASDKGQGSCASGAVTFHVTVNPTALVVSCSDQSVLWGDVAAQTIGVSGGCSPYIYEVTSGPGAVDGSGNWSFASSCADVGSVPVTVSVEDAVGQITSCTFQLDVTNTAPTCTNPADVTVPSDGLEYTVVLGPATDADGDALVYTQTSGPAWGAIVGNEWKGTRAAGDDLEYVVCFSVSDGCAATATDCCFTAKFESPYIVCFDDPDSAGVQSYVQTLGGRNKDICVWVDPTTGSSKGVGGFDFLICYDQSGLTFQNASRGADLSPEWEYFTWRTGMFGGNCGGACPNGYVRLVGIADMNNGIAPSPGTFTLGGCIVNLTFYVTADQNMVNSCLHVGFCSYDCGDNVISSKDGNTLFIPSSGVTLGPDYANCTNGGGNGKPAAEPFGDYCLGAICIVPPPDDRGDINLNGIANEIGDAVLFSNYFINGSIVWDPVYFEIQIFSTDINNDGLTLTIADLVYLIRIITGDEQPFDNNAVNPKVSPYANSVSVISDVRGDQLTVSTNASVELGGAVLVYRYSGLTIGEPVLASGSGLKMKSRAQNGELRVVIFPDPAVASGKVDAGINDLVTIPVNGDGTIELVESQFSDANGGLLTVEAAKVGVPTSYALHQNFPNPFNAGTVIPVSLVEASEWSLSIYNVAGQLVRTFSGESEAGTINIEWDGTSADGEVVASGMYFYRVNANDFTATKKMVLLK